MKKIIQKHMYKWHRRFGIMVLIPTLLWTVSGMMHPFMSHWFKTDLPNTFYQEEKIEISENSLELKEIFVKNKITGFKNVRIVNYQAKNYFQVKKIDNSIRYFNTLDGEELVNGERLYAESIARFMTGDHKSKISSIELLTDFTPQYKYVNRLLPVWKVSFDRDDHMDIYVETAQSKFATFNDDKRKTFIWIFSNFHNWEFMNLFKSTFTQIFVILLFLGIIFFSAISGIVIYCFHWKFFKKPESGNKIGVIRRYHRILGVSFSLFTFLFAFSGGYHLIQKLTPDDRMTFFNEPIFKSTEISDTLRKLSENEINFAFVRLEDKALLQTESFDFKAKSPVYTYFDIETGIKLKDGNEKYCTFLANKCIQKNGEKMDVDNIEELTDFTNEYGFVNKRLPVMAFHLKNENKSSYYIDPLTGQLAAYIQDGDRLEGFSFAFLHKFHFLDTLGKNARDGILVFFALSICVISILGLIVFIRK